MQGDAGQQSVTVTVKTLPQAIQLADEWRAYAERLERMCQRQHAENERLRIFLKAADTLAAHDAI